MTVPGYSKGFGYQLGQSFSGEFDHAWNAVFLEGRWHLTGEAPVNQLYFNTEFFFKKGDV